MRHNKFFSPPVALYVIAFLTISWTSPAPAPSPAPVTITALFTGGTFPVLTGTFTTTGALVTSGTVTMAISPNENGRRAHCILTLVTSDGTFIIKQECQFATSPAKGRWQIVSGTGAYANLRGNGSLLMPPATEAMTGVIY